MSKVWKTETGRAFHSVGFILSLILGFVLTMSQAICHYLAFSKGRSYEIMKGIASYNPTTVFTQWFPMDLPYWSSVVFYLMFPVLAAMPFSASYLQDKKSGYLKNVYIRTEKKHYLAAKYMAVFLSGGAAVTLPLCLNFLFATLYLPWRTPDAIVFTILPSTVFIRLLYTHPFVYTMLFLAATFVSAGLYATVSLVAACLVKNSFTVFLAPFLLAMLIYNLAQPLGCFDIISFYMLAPGRTASLRAEVYGGFLLALFAMTFFGFFLGGMKDDVL